MPTFITSLFFPNSTIGLCLWLLSRALMAASRQLPLLIYKETGSFVASLIVPLSFQLFCFSDLEDVLASP